MRCALLLRAPCQRTPSNPSKHASKRLHLGRDHLERVPLECECEQKLPCRRSVSNALYPRTECLRFPLQGEHRLRLGQEHGLRGGLTGKCPHVG